MIDGVVAVCDPDNEAFGMVVVQRVRGRHPTTPFIRSISHAEAQAVRLLPSTKTWVLANPCRSAVALVHMSGKRHG